MSRSACGAMWRVALAAVCFCAAQAHAAAPPTPVAPAVSAEELMAKAESQAAAEHKNVLLTFSASWCGPCHLLERFLNDPTMRPILEKAFVLVDLDTGEKPRDKAHSNVPGGDNVRDAVGAGGTGYPFTVVLSPAGKVIIDSQRPVENEPGENIGYPSGERQIEWFMEMLGKGGPLLSSADRDAIRHWLTVH